MPRLVSTALAALIGLFGPLSGLAIAQAVRLDSLPTPVQETFRREAGAQAQVTEIEVDTDDGRTKYEIEYRKDGRGYEIEIDPSGRVLKHHLHDPL